MVSLLSAADSCVNIAAGTNGWGMPTSWVLTGESELYAGVLETDGYQITAFVTWRDVSGISATISPAEPVNTGVAVMGTCVETLDSSGAQLGTGL